MPKGKPWTNKEEKQLRSLLADKNTVVGIAKIMGKTKDAIYGKMDSLGLKEEKRAKITLFSSSSLILPDELSTIEEVLKTLAAAVKQLETPGLDPSETLRLRSMIQGLKVYKEIFAEYADYRGLEQRLIELEAKYREVITTPKSHASS